MDNTAVIQVRLPTELKEASEKRAGEVGLSSVQEAIRMFLHSFVNKRVGLGIIPEIKTEEVKLTKTAKKRYAEIEQDLDEKKNTVAFEDPEKALEWLIKSIK
jgi:antitoxin component of RelBE/YafQ-DinJ toxin-antitoxin module